MKQKIFYLIVMVFSIAFILAFPKSANALTYHLASSDINLVGNLQYTRVMPGDSLESVGREYDVGYNELVAANRHVDPRYALPEEKELTIPTMFLLPTVERKGIVVNLAEMRLYFFPEGSNYLMTFPVGIGKVGSTIPLGTTAVKQKKENPRWYPTANIRAYNEAQGVFLPAYVPAGPDNPLGNYAIYLNVPEYLIHSTIHTGSIGKRSSFGCIRMYEEDVEQLFRRIGKDVPVHVINQSVKLGWYEDTLYLEVHPLLEEEYFTNGKSLRQHVKEALNQPAYQNINIDWQTVDKIIRHPSSIPKAIARRAA